MTKSKLLMITLSLVVVSVIFVGCRKSEVRKVGNNTQVEQTGREINESEKKGL